MSQPVLFKIYGNLWPASEAEYEKLKDISRLALPAPENSQIVNLANGLLTISFEGTYFPADEILETLSSCLTPEQQGKLDILDIQEWRLMRHSISDGKIHARSASLNNVLDYSGH